MSETTPNRRLADLLVEPREDLDVEVKGWLDLAGSGEHKATLAKALLALANHGGGYVLLGLTETDSSIVPATGRPATLNNYSQDQVNGIVQSYAEPPFHCAVHHLAGPDGGVHPIVVVPGGHRVPVRAKRSGPNGEIVQVHAIYIRRPGAKSEVPQSAREWDELPGPPPDGRPHLARRGDHVEHERVGSVGITQPRRGGAPATGAAVRTFRFLSAADQPRPGGAGEVARWSLLSGFGSRAARASACPSRYLPRRVETRRYG